MRTAPALLIASIALLALTSCVKDDGPVIPDPLPSSTPIFASDEEALAAAEEAYAAYLAASDQILSKGGAQPERISQFVVPALLPEIMDGFALYSDRGWRAVGSSAYDSVELQQYVDTGSAATVALYACLDVSGIRILDSSGTDVTPIDRQDRLPLELEFEQAAGGTPLLSRSELWSGDDFCVP